jgi:hypothetical protein
VNRALYAAATGMAAQQQNLDVIADNLANADVAGFKSAQATFEAIGGDESLGTASAGVHRIFAQGTLMKTGGSTATVFSAWNATVAMLTRAPGRSRAQPTARCAIPTGGRYAACISRRMPSTLPSRQMAA